ncbi:MAG: tRNA uridine-5-carboxymethylaminomethyl(34) synthesis enzyme MnmG [Chitinophagales bacterium]|nr:tRNA uridine-5-carboxymethylaminomethyl(34) synthesis enzyme MnmG [Chitinophagales bacterium]HAE14576.1 tRNA uridine-5-carboxymethylaminomethyl(34) synthesis enzyme MnmG [Bacteroidota bacterium]MCB9022895.1 tRNA uridine-5-carboxymethylaminomethyl(34) synthesis enzyme MnmG [Chitinophagales bacterium]HPE97325.1 tRNA uridine-5-carboxymethylaminomethyl(34) synthesis enzyme MnmG [Chitinophagales bacterium]HPR28690.1 tRNA uridine-5-carboxymethylaminomethyl(34) synthesis enzyme MnmG [Chitinophagale
MFPEYDVIVVGAGHAGCEAAAAAANMGSKVMLVTMNMQTIAQMSCNPAMGGVAKGQIVREIDALGGYSGIVTDETAIQFRMLNRSKGPAMWSPRAQSDRLLFAKLWREKLEQTPGVDFWQDTVVGLLVKDGQVEGVRTGMGMEIRGKAVVLTNGTFLNGLIHVGMKQFGGGRMAEKPASGITEQLVELGFESGRMKTGTPPRVDGRSLDYSKMEEQPGDVNPGKFSYTDTKPLQLQRSCHVTYTSQEVHDALRKGFDESPMFSGRIKGPGPRYCPSIEDKIDRFASKDRHQIFVEPEGWNTVEVYVNGFSTSLPEQVQFEALRKIAGFENVRMFRPGYAIEYDYFPPVQLTHSLETRLVRNLFFAGQINGTTGYEEAACQGLMAGINAHQSVHDLPPFEISRSEGYIGVLIDDLINKGTEEPYRMFTSRAEFRVLLRQDNADLRLTEKSHTLGLADIGRLHQVIEKRAQTSAITDLLQKLSVAPDQVNGLLEELGSAPLKQKMKATSIISRPHVGIKDLATVIPDLKTALAAFSEEYLEQAEIEIKYEGYVAKEQEIAEKMQRLEDVSLSESLDYHKLQSLSSEAREKLSRVRPRTLGQASRISGVSPADISVLMVYMGR